MNSFIPNRDLYLSFLLVAERDGKSQILEANPTVHIRIGDQPFRRVDFPVKEVGRGWYDLVVPAQYVGGYKDIILCASAEGSLEWRSMIGEEEFHDAGGNVFVQNPLPDLDNVSTLGPDLLGGDWSWNDKGAGGRIVEESADRVVVELGSNTGTVLQLFQPLPIAAGRYRILADYAGDAASVSLDVIQHGAPYDNLGDPETWTLSIAPGLALNVDVLLKADSMARFRFIIPPGVDPGRQHEFFGLSLRKYL
jgi:hypothetical protein